MLQLDVVVSESFDETTSEFVTDTHTLELEHSLLSLSKWESKYQKPFLSKETKTEDEVLDYIVMMDLGAKTPPEVFQKIDNDQYFQINDYINAKLTATWFGKKGPGKPNTQAVTSELIYYWITAYEIPWAAENWHLSRLFTLLEVFSEERGSADKKKTVNRAGAESMAAERQRINAERKAQMQTQG